MSRTVGSGAETPSNGVTELDANKNYSHLEFGERWLMRLNKNTPNHFSTISLLFSTIFYDFSTVESTHLYMCSSGAYTLDHYKNSYNYAQGHCRCNSKCCSIASQFLFFGHSSKSSGESSASQRSSMSTVPSTMHHVASTREPSLKRQRSTSQFS